MTEKLSSKTGNVKQPVTEGKTNKTRKRSRLEDIALIIALFFSGLGFFLALWDRIDGRKHDRLSVAPHVFTSRSNEQFPGRYLLEISNTGLGPAILSDFQISIAGFKDGLNVPQECNKLVMPWSLAGAGTIDIQCRTFSLKDGVYVLPAGESIEILKLRRFDINGEVLPGQVLPEDIAKTISFSAKYCSIYKECNRLGYVPD
ncbi:MAG: hypothetical protein JXQ85_05100 [Cognatishimia sp.]|uniref:hypothetical protein n=1 Tax=Cognatishimia sp. TaxID=2211648 RepID=UPI003B8DBE67